MQRRQWYSLRQLALAIGLHRQTIIARVRDGTFPQPKPKPTRKKGEYVEAWSRLDMIAMKHIAENITRFVVDPKWRPKARQGKSDVS